MKRTVLITGLRAPVALHWCRLFAAAGWRVFGADSLRDPVGRFSRSIKSYLHLPPPRSEPDNFAKAISSAVEETDADLILPTCEEVLFLAQAALRPEAKGWAQRLFAPSLEDLITLHDKAAFNALLARVAPDFAPSFQNLETGADAAALGEGPWVLKPRFSRFATSVLIKPDRATILRLPISPEQPWLAQAYLPGEEICLSAVAVGGQVLALQAYEPLLRLRQGRGASVAFAASEDGVGSQLRPMVEAVAKALNVTGQLSFDLRRDAEGQWRALECNPRATSGFHFFGPDDGLVEAVAEGRSALTARTRPTGEVLGEAVPALLAGGIRGLSLCLGLMRSKAGATRRLRPLSAWPGDTISPLEQSRAFFELWLRSRAHRCSLEEASTLDICWNGPSDRSPLP